MAPRSNVRLDRGMRHALPLIEMVCRLAGPFDFIDDGRAALKRAGVLGAVRRHETGVLFDWLMDILSYQGIADRVAWQYLRDHGNVTWTAVDRALRRKPSCPKVGGYWRFIDCGYKKGSGICSEPAHIGACPLPTHTLRNGRLNQTAYSLYLFMRDVARGDFVQWIDDQLASCADLPEADRLAAMRASLIEPLRGVYGISDKVISMALSSVLLRAGSRRPYWFDVGASFVVVDTLVHNFLHRTGILRQFDASHAYGAACYRPNGCADVIERVAHEIDASTFNPAFPKTFPRFVQYAIWQYCSEGGFDICNGNRIDDTARCNNIYCRLRGRCERVTLHKTRESHVISAA